MTTEKRKAEQAVVIAARDVVLAIRSGEARRVNQDYTGVHSSEQRREAALYRLCVAMDTLDEET